MSTSTTWLEVARITETSWAEYRWRCQGCTRGEDDLDLSVAGSDAKRHAVYTGHEVIIERKG